MTSHTMKMSLVHGRNEVGVCVYIYKLYSYTDSRVFTFRTAVHHLYTKFIYFSSSRSSPNTNGVSVRKMTSSKHRNPVHFQTFFFFSFVEEKSDQIDLNISTTGHND